MQEKGLLLLVDDDVTVTSLLSALLINEGLEVIATNDPLEILQLARCHKPDIIATDLMMPDLNGFEICQLLVADRETKNIPVLVVTALDDQSSRDKSFMLGAVAYLTKPFDIDAFLKLLDDLLRGKRLGLYDVE